MEIIRQWIITILSVIIFITFLEILLPNSKHRRYINVIVGLLIMLVILKPITGLIQQQFSISDGIIQSSNQLEMMTMQNHYKNVDYTNKENVIKLYKQQVKEQMLDRLVNQWGHRVHDLEISIIEDEGDSFGMIEGVRVMLMEEGETVEVEGDIGIPEISVNVVVGGKNNNKPADDSILINNEGDEIKKNLSDFYSISKDSIIVTVLKNKK